MPELQNWLNSFVTWFQDDFFTISVLEQGAYFVFASLFAVVFGRRTANWSKTTVRPFLEKRKIHLTVSANNFFIQFYLTVILAIGVLIARAWNIPVPILQISALLLGAWLVIRLTASLIESTLWARLVAVILWVILALFILGWLQEAINLLDAAALQVGKFRLSILALIRGLFMLCMIFWAASAFGNVIDHAFSKAPGMTPSQKVLYAKLGRILIYTLAVVIGLNLTGIDLTALTIFSGALGLGIGFGLQKVFSNLISGIILLMDKSVKPGDVVAIGETYGWVNKLSARYVSVITRDGKEHLIPNENLITEQVENWSYTDNKVRLHIPVRVSYDSDQHKARALMLEAVIGHPRLLKAPAPTCFILEFKEDAVIHEIRCWIEDPANGVVNVKSDVYYRIWDLFHANGIKFPFAQQDIYIKQMPAPHQ